MNPYRIVNRFEDVIAEWSGSRYAVAVESCCAALQLCCEYLQVGTITIPRNTYPGVANAIIRAGGRLRFTDVWDGGTIYKLWPADIVDGALRFRAGMFTGGFHCLSFHDRKHLPIGRGGMILLDDAQVAAWLRRMRFDGRGECPLADDTITHVGMNAYMTPEQAARGLQLFEAIRDRNLPDLLVEDQGYARIDLERMPAYQRFIEKKRSA